MLRRETLKLRLLEWSLFVVGKVQRALLPIWKFISCAWPRRPDSRHPIVVAGAVGLASTLLIPFSARYAEVQRSIQLRIETREELVQYSATVMNSFRTIDQIGQQVSRHRLSEDDLLTLEKVIQEATNQIHTAQHLLDAHVAFRFRDALVQREFKAHSDMVRSTLDKIVDFRSPRKQRQQALQKYWDESMNRLNAVVAYMDHDIELPARRVYKYVLFGGGWRIAKQEARGRGQVALPARPGGVGDRPWWRLWLPVGDRTVIVPGSIGPES